MLPLKRLQGQLRSPLSGFQTPSSGVVRSTTACRRSVAERTADVASSEAPQLLKVRRGLSARSRRVPAPPRDEPSEPGEPSTASAASSDLHSATAAGHDGASLAALRDATATASPSGHDHLPVSTGVNGRARLKATAAAAAAARQRTLRAGGAAVAAASAAAEDALADTNAAHDSPADAAGAAARTRTVGKLALEQAGRALPEPEPAQQPQEQQRQPVAGSTEDDGGGGGGEAVKEKAKNQHWLPPHVTAERDKDIHDELQACEDWRDVLDVLADEGAHLSLRTGVQALGRLNGLSRGGPGRAELVRAPEFVALLTHLYSLIPCMNNVQLSTTLHALAQLQVPPSEAVMAAYFEAAAARVENFYPRDIAMFFGALAALRPAPPPPQALLDALSFRAQAFITAGEFEARGISTLLHSCVLLGYKNRILAAAAAERLAQPGVLPSLTPQGVANSMWALGRIGHYHEALVEGAVAAFALGWKRYKPQECANLLWALTAFRHHPGPAFELFAKSLLANEPLLRAADLATLFYALATFNVAPGAALLDRLAGRAGQLVSARAANGVELCNMYWGLALLGEWGRPLFGQLGEALAAHVEGGGHWPESLQRMVFQGFLAARLANEEQTPPPLPALAWDAMKRAWYNNVNEYAQRLRSQEEATRKMRPSDIRGARFQLAQILHTLRVRHDRSRVTGDNLAVIDFAMKAGPERFIALQLLEKEERCVNSKQVLGNANLQRQLLERNGWEVRFLVAQDLTSLAPEAQPLFVADLLRRCGVAARLPTAAEPGAAAEGEQARARVANDADILAKLDSRPVRRPVRRGGK